MTLTNKDTKAYAYTLTYAIASAVKIIKSSKQPSVTSPTDIQTVISNTVLDEIPKLMEQLINSPASREVENKLRLKVTEEDELEVNIKVCEHQQEPDEYDITYTYWVSFDYDGYMMEVMFDTDTADLHLLLSTKSAPVHQVILSLNLQTGEFQIKHKRSKNVAADVKLFNKLRAILLAIIYPVAPWITRHYSSIFTTDEEDGKSTDTDKQSSSLGPNEVDLSFEVIMSKDKPASDSALGDKEKPQEAQAKPETQTQSEAQASEQDIEEDYLSEEMREAIEKDAAEKLLGDVDPAKITEYKTDKELIEQLEAKLNTVDCDIPDWLKYYIRVCKDEALVTEARSAWLSSIANKLYLIAEKYSNGKSALSNDVIKSVLAKIAGEKGEKCAAQFRSCLMEEAMKKAMKKAKKIKKNKKKKKNGSEWSKRWFVK